ncbi:MAG: DUF2325 domain-containing protein [Syntrophomonadaceae bacterium]|nr:DUF2325 domain-containing protein [Syntrophomonadaceae bacterium]
MDGLNIKNPVNQLQLVPDKSKKRKRAWEIPSDLFCSVCGTCLDLDEQRMILKKLNINHKTLSDHEIHAFMVQGLYSENKISRRLDSHLNDKYSYEISEFGKYDEDHFMKVWQEQVKSGDICGLYWAAVTHQGLSEKAMHRFFCDVHMMSHLNGGKTRQEKSEYERMLRVKSELLDKLRQEKKKSKGLAKELALLEKNYRTLTTKLQSLETTPPGSQDLPKVNSPIDRLAQENRDLNAKLKQTEHDLSDCLELVHNFEKEKERLESDLRVQKENNMQLYNEIDSLIRSLSWDKQECLQNECCSGLCEKRVLIVGGLTKLRSFYRDLIENLGGNFEYHDGYLRSGERELEGLIKKSDIILCPVDCNSHGACLSVKKICNRIKKPYQMLPSSSLSSISQALTVVSKT